MRYVVEHTINFVNGTSTRPYRLTRTFSTTRGALRAGEKHALEVGKYYEDSQIREHAIVVRDQAGRFITNLAA
jgi:hypothetical protein